jgi:hypothetical protein
MLANTFAGVVFGLLLTRPVIQEIYSQCYSFLFRIGCIGVVWLIFVDKFHLTLARSLLFNSSTWYLFLAIGLQLIFITFIMRKILNQSQNKTR